MEKIKIILVFSLVLTLLGVVPQEITAGHDQGYALASKDKSQKKPVYYRDKVMVLMYHEVSENPSVKSIITPSQLEEQLTAIQKAGFHVITMEQYTDFMLRKQSVPDNAVVLTFDDGYESFYSIVFPILKKLNMKATNFVIVSTIENPAHHGIPKMTWAQMREMKEEGMSFYSHTYDSHVYASIDAKGTQKPALANRLYMKKLGRMETKEEYIARVKKDLSLSESILRQNLGNTQGVLAFPYGAYNRDVVKIAKETDIPIMFTVDPGINKRGNHIGYRLNAGNQNITTSALIHSMKNQGTKIKYTSSPKVVKKVPSTSKAVG